MSSANRWRRSIGWREVSNLVGWIMGDEDALKTLQAICNDREASGQQDQGCRRRDPLRAVQAHSQRQDWPRDLGERLDSARTMKTVEPLTIEHQPEAQASSE